VHNEPFTGYVIGITAAFWTIERSEFYISFSRWFRNVPKILRFSLALVQVLTAVLVATIHPSIVDIVP
jgi:hypothetical protein